jgi:glycosyltransferase involved in cell wall biosynthesis
LLLIAPMADRDDVGESWSAYQWASRLAEHHEVTVLTYFKQGHGRPSVQLPGVRVIEWAEPPFVGRAERLNSMLKPAYLPFYVRCRRWIKQALARGERFDLAHQLVPLAMRYPSPVAGLGLPYLLGPVGGSLDTPIAFAGEDSAPWYVELRRLDAFRIRHDRQLRHTYAGAACVIGIAPYVEQLLSPVPIQHFEAMSDTGVEQLPDPIDRSARTGPLRLLYVGRMVRTKGARDAIRAISRLADVDVTLDLAGDGFDRPACEALISELGLQHRVTMHGRVPRDQVDAMYRDADVFVFPSYREPGGNVVAEAMGFGLPMIVSDRGGPGYVVDDTSGFRISPVDPAQFAADIAAAIRRLVEDPALRTSMGRCARDRIAQLALWPNKVARLEAIYAEVLAR